MVVDQRTHEQVVDRIAECSLVTDPISNEGGGCFEKNVNEKRDCSVSHRRGTYYIKYATSHLMIAFTESTEPNQFKDAEYEIK